MKNKNKILVITVVMMFLLSFSFTNADEKATLSIPLSHELIGDTVEEDFEFVLESLNEESPLPETTKLKIKGNSETKFDLTFDKVGKFNYLIREVEGNNNSIIYDKTQYKIVVVTEYVEGNLSASAIIEDGTETKVEKVVFKDVSNKKPVIVEEENSNNENDTIKNPKVAITSPIVNKIIKNNNEYTDTFTFNLKGKDINSTTKVKGVGFSKFPKLIFTKAGKYEFTITENKTSKLDWNYDNSKQKYIVNVLNKEGKLVAIENKKEFKFTNSPRLFKKAKQVVNRIVDNSGGNNSQTGDFNRNIALFGGIAVVSLLVIVILSKQRK